MARCRVRAWTVMMVMVVMSAAMFATSAKAAPSPDIIRPSAVALDARAYITPYFLQNTTSALDQLLLFYSYVPQWWMTWGNPVPLHVVLPDYFGDIFRFPYTDANNNTMPFAYFVIEEIKSIPNVVMSVTTGQNTAAALAAKNGNICQYGAKYGIACDMRIETANVSYAPGTFYDLGFQYLQQSLLNTTTLLRKQGLNTTAFLLPYVIHDLNSLAEMTVTPNAGFANAAPDVSIWISDSSLIQYYGMNATQAIFQFTNTLYRTAHLRVKKMQVDATTLLTGSPQNLQQFINYAATQGVQVELYLSNIQWGLTTYNGYYNAYTTLNTAINFIYSGNQTYPPSDPGTIPTMTPAPSTSVPTFPPSGAPTGTSGPTNFPSNLPTDGPGQGNGANSTGAPTAQPTFPTTTPSGTTQQASPASPAVHPVAILIAALVAWVTLLAAASV